MLFKSGICVGRGGELVLGRFSLHGISWVGVVVFALLGALALALPELILCDAFSFTVLAIAVLYTLVLWLLSFPVLIIGILVVEMPFRGG